MTRTEIAKKIIKEFESKSEEFLGHVNHSYILGRLETFFEDVFNKLSDEDVEIYVKRFNID